MGLGLLFCPNLGGCSHCQGQGGVRLQAKDGYAGTVSVHTHKNTLLSHPEQAHWKVVISPHPGSTEKNRDCGKTQQNYERVAFL